MEKGERPRGGRRGDVARVRAGHAHVAIGVEWITSLWFGDGADLVEYVDGGDEAGVSERGRGRRAERGYHEAPTGPGRARPGRYRPGHESRRGGGFRGLSRGS